VKKLLHNILQKMLRTTYNLFNKWENSTASDQKTFHFLIRSCCIQILALHSGNGHMQKSTLCYLQL